MKKQNIIIVLLLITAVVIVLGLKSKKQQLAQINTQETSAGANLHLPKLLELGSVTCIPCKMMAPILDELKTTYAGQLNVEFIDTISNKNEAEQYNVRVIPTQIFLDADSKVLFRHEGFFAKEDILTKWKELGYNLVATNQEPSE